MHLSPPVQARLAKGFAAAVEGAVDVNLISDTEPAVEE